MVYNYYIFTFIGNSCPFVKTRSTCCKVMENAGIELSTFNKSVAHGIHSISMEQINSLFNGKVTEHNNVPTTNLNLYSDKRVLPYAPKVNKNPIFLTRTMNMIDFILSNNDDTRGFLISGLPSLEKLVHSAHMEELYARTKIVYEDIISNPPQDLNLCNCVTDENSSGIIGYLDLYATRFRVSFRDFKSGFTDTQPSLETSQDWRKWSEGLHGTMMTKNETYNLAMYLYCKLHKIH